MASSAAILEPKIILESVSGDDVLLCISPEWKQKFANFLKYAATTDDVEVAPVISVEGLDDVRKAVDLAGNKNNSLQLSKRQILHVMPALVALDVMNHCDFYDYPADDFDRLHDDFMSIYEGAINSKRARSRRIKVGLASEFDG